MSEGAEGYSWTQRPVRRLGAAAHEEEEDAVAVEEPLEIRVGGATVAITMRTPGREGDDRRLALGFLLAEGVIAAIEDVAAVSAPLVTGEPFCNAIDLALAPEAAARAAAASSLERARRGTLTSAACGVCGRASIDDLLAQVVPFPPGAAARASEALVLSAPSLLRGAQPTFARTGAVHAAAALDEGGAVLAAAEDVGRHNAVDKVVGALLEGGVLGRAALLAVSGRVSFEMVQKAAAARIPSVAGVGGATSMAVDLARRAGMTLAAFVRDGRASVYAGGGAP